MSWLLFGGAYLLLVGLALWLLNRYLARRRRRRTLVVLIHGFRIGPGKPWTMARAYLARKGYRVYAPDFQWEALALLGIDLIAEVYTVTFGLDRRVKPENQAPSGVPPDVVLLMAKHSATDDPLVLDVLGEILAKAVG